MQAAGERQRRLLGMILADPPPSPELLAGLARAAAWVRRFELQLALRVRQLDGSRVAGRGNPPRSAPKDTEATTDGQP